MRATLLLSGAIALALLAACVLPPGGDGDHVRAAMSTFQAPPGDPNARIDEFLRRMRGRWRDLNVPEADGRRLHDLIVERGFTRALEIGTSTGHSAIWIARALRATGGRLITLEIDPERHREALANFAAAGVADLIDARLGDAHALVPTLEGPFDVVFSDADKEWYTNYFTAIWPTVVPGGCFTAHNVRGRQRGIAEFLDHLETVPGATTTIDRASSAGLSITCRRASPAPPG